MCPLLRRWVRALLRPSLQAALAQTARMGLGGRQELATGGFLTRFGEGGGESGIAMEIPPEEG